MRHSTAWWQPDDKAEQENSSSILQLEEQADAEDGKVLGYYELDANYEQEGQGPSNEPVTQEEGEDNSNTEYAKIKLPHLETCQIKA